MDYQRLADACDQRTRVISVSWIGYATGYRCDPATVGEIARQKGAFFLLDAIQGLGVFPLDVRAAGVDFLAADGHKWLLAPEGAGLAYIRHELLDRLRPTIVGWNSVVGRFDFQQIDLQLRPEAARYEAGAQNMIGQLAFGGSLQTLFAAGLSNQSWALADQVLHAVQSLVPRLQDVGAVVAELPAAVRSGIVVFQLPGHDPAVVRQKLLESGVVTSCRGGKVRVAVHAYNHSQDFDRLLNGLQDIGLP
jgi:selenocysteine lyase/cysteine desulfurase